MESTTRPLAATVDVPGTPVFVLAEPPQFSSKDSEKPPLPSPVSRPTMTSGAVPLPHEARPVRESTIPPFNDALEKPPEGVC